MQGWIKLHRKVMESDTFSKLNAVQQIISIYIVLNANHEDGVWYDKYKDIEVEVKRGQLVTSRKKIADEWFKGDKEVTEQKIRTTLKKLEKYGFLTITSTNNYTLLEVLNYNVYQQKESEANQVSNQELTKDQPTNNQEETTNKNDKNVNNDKNVKKEEISIQIKNLRQRYSDIQLSVIDKYLEVIRHTRVSAKISDSVVLGMYKDWDKHPEICVEYGLRTHSENPSYHSKKENYTIGIIRNTSADEAFSKLNQKGGKHAKDQASDILEQYNIGF